MVEIFEKKGT